ncbi:SDR family NAD(P)-dependent oxidoreductase, partial [bacterium]|nr:SDR family NAD(P)-dependent oxidoreductase [bacterium]
MVGIGFVVAKQLAQQFAAKLVLVNRTTLRERSDWAAWLRDHAHDDAISININKVRELEQLGADVQVFSGDVTDVTRMRDIVQAAEAQYGAINGVIHAAGVVNDNLIPMKHQAEIEEVFAPKVYGTLVLDSLFDGKPLDFMVLFSSTSTVIAPVGQIDYVAANAFLNAYAQKRNAEQPGYTLAVNWGIWNEVGMAADTAVKMGYGTTQSDAGLKHSVSYPWFDSHEEQVVKGKKIHLFSAHYSPQQLWVLDQHRTKSGQALLPGTAYLELVRAALLACGEKAPFDIRELIFLKALYIPDQSSRAVRVKLSKTLSGYDFAIQSEARDSKGEKGWQTHAEAYIELVDSTAAAPELDALQARFELPASDEASTVLQSSQEDHLLFGPRWQVLREAKYLRSDDGDAEALARLRLDDRFAADLSDHHLHPGLLDIATGYAMRLIKGYVDSAGSASGLAEVKASHLWVPVSYKRFRYYRPLPQQIYSWVRNHGDNSVDNDFASFDITLFDNRGKVLVEVEKLTIKQMRESIDFSSEDVHVSLERDASAEKATEFRQLSPAEMAFQHNLSQGILPVEGTEFFEQLVNVGQAARMIVSSLPLEGLIEEAAAAAASLHQEESGAKFSRPELDNDYIAPRDDIEKTLVGFWEELLGVDQVGVEDSFFDLGGHSLIAVRLFAKIQQTYDVDYPISILFEASTIASCAALYRQAVG